MSELPDSVFEELTAGLFEDPVAEPSPAEPEPPEANAIEPDVPPSDPSVEAEPTEPVAAEPDPIDERLAAIEERERLIAQREQEQTEQRNKVIAQWQAWQEQQAEQKASAYYQQLTDEYGPEVAEQYKTLRTTDLQMRRQAEQRATGAEHGLTAAMVALEHINPEVFQQVLEATERLVGYPDATQMQAALAQEREQATKQNAEIAKLTQMVRELRSQVEAKSRPEIADAVDRGQAGPATGLRPQDAPDFDGFFERLIASA